ncbi:Spartin [Cytospora mali]|uniref:Spartin n=1 Tax=Cytospora mali TaxID=578113 RepID=A0A194VVU7_CYTMA|nr:Spartin [Valsa mali]
MASGHNDPKLLYAVNGVSAYHLAHGKEQSLTPAGPQTLSLLMVPTSSPFADTSAAGSSDGPAEEDFYLHLHLPPELDLPLPATTQIYHQPPTSYLIPRWDLGPDSGAFTRIEFPTPGSRPGVQEDVDTFETILAQCTAFLERAPPPVAKDKKSSATTSPRTKTSPARSKAALAAEDALPAYNPGDYKPGEAYAEGSHSSIHGGQIVLVDEEDGSVIGELGEGYQVIEDSSLRPGSKDPVQIVLPQNGSNQIAVSPARPEDVEMVLHPAYKKSFLVSNAAAASQLIITGSSMVSKALQSGADSFTQKTKPAAKPVTFKPTTKEHVRRVHTFTTGAADLSAKTVGQIGKVAQNVGATLARQGRKNDGLPRGYDKDGKPLESYKPGLLNKSMMAFSTVADGIEQASRSLLESTSNAATTVVAHKWGPEAGDVTRSLSGGVKNVGLVYIDVTGVSRRAILKSVAKGMVVGRGADGKEVVVGGGDGGETATMAGALPNPQLPEGRESSSENSSISGAEGKKPAIKY